MQLQLRVLHDEMVYAEDPIGGRFISSLTSHAPSWQGLGSSLSTSKCWTFVIFVQHS